MDLEGEEQGKFGLGRRKRITIYAIYKSYSFCCFASSF